MTFSWEIDDFDELQSIVKRELKSLGIRISKKKDGCKNVSLQVTLRFHLPLIFFAQRTPVQHIHAVPCAGFYVMFTFKECVPDKLKPQFNGILDIINHRFGVIYTSTDYPLEDRKSMTQRSNYGNAVQIHHLALLGKILSTPP